jgi:hypothetical protein
MYHQERTTLSKNFKGVNDLPMEKLRELARKIWELEAPKKRKFPTITAIRGYLT